MIDLVCATRLTSDEFWGRSALGLSLRRMSHDDRLKARVFFENRRGLPSLYNERIAAEDASPVIAFIHDDVWLDDYFFFEHVVTGVQAFDVIGVAGNRRRAPLQPSWAFPSIEFKWDDRANLSGVVSHGPSPFATISAFGPVPAACELLDGVLLAAQRDVLRAKQVSFDERFEFHFYDMDFCRSARAAGLRLGTWPVAITHQSEGGFGSNAWLENYKKYIGKWGD
ncbi:glycosyltransferase [Roseateles sp. P5_E7]